jgi:hypothetical protein
VLYPRSDIFRKGEPAGLVVNNGGFYAAPCEGCDSADEVVPFADNPTGPDYVMLGNNGDYSIAGGFGLAVDAEWCEGLAFIVVPVDSVKT